MENESEYDRKHQALRLYNALALDPGVDRVALLKWLLEQFGLQGEGLIKHAE